MSVKSLVEAALQHARSTAGISKTASAPDGDDLIKLANQLADANEYLAAMAVDDGSVEGAIRRDVVERYFKGADAESIPGPAQSISPTGTQAVAPQSGVKKILPTGKASGDMPAESVAPTGTQATLDQTGTKKADGSPMTLLDLITAKHADTQSIPGPTESVSGQNAAAPPGQNENSNIDLVRSAEGIVNATKRDAKLPTRARLRQLFAHASDTGASRAAAAAAFPQATAKGGLKEAAIAVTDAGHKYEADKARALEALHTKLKGSIGDYTREQPLLSYVGGKAVRVPLHQLAARHQSYIAKKHEDKKQSLNPFGGLLTKTQAEKGASLLDYANLYELAATGQLGEEAQAVANFVESM